MIVLDIETTGTDFLKNGIWQIGAIDTSDPERIFLDECRICDDETVTKEALDICGVTEEYVRGRYGREIQTEKELLEKFFRWCRDSDSRNFVCQNPQFDTTFLRAKASKHDLEYPFHYRAFDLHSIASLKYMDIYGVLPVDKGISQMNLSNILFFCGMRDNRDKHNALEDAKLTAECFSRIVFCKTFLKEFEQYAIPDYLKAR